MKYIITLLVLLTLGIGTYEIQQKLGTGGFNLASVLSSTSTNDPVSEIGIPTVDTSSTCPTTQFNTNRTVGSSGNDVAALQNFLYIKGFGSNVITGYFGPLTRSSLIAYQTTNSIAPADGSFGALTRSLMTSQCVGTTTLVRTPDVPSLLTKANLTVNGVKDITLKVGDIVSYAWSSEHADKFTSSYTTSCIKGTYEWRAKTVQGTYKLKLVKTNSGCTYNIVYKAINSKTKEVATDSIILRVSK